MSAIDDLPPLRDVIREHSLSARKSLGQNFLLDLNLTARIARAAGPLEGATVIEVGPGPGGLTRALLALGASNALLRRLNGALIEPLEGLNALMAQVRTQGNYALRARRSGVAFPHCGQAADAASTARFTSAVLASAT